jgi:hypothetical protein
MQFQLSPRCSAVALLLALLAFSGCTGKNYSWQEPEVRDIVGRWALAAESRQPVEAACTNKIAANDGILTIRADGTILAQGFPATPQFKVALFSGPGSWSIVHRAKVWEIALQITNAPSGEIINVILDVGHDGDKTFLDQPIDQPDGELMRFDRTGDP